MTTKLIHRGQYIQGSSPQTILYAGMRGTSKILNYGLQMEYSLFNMSDERHFNPYFSLGLLGNSNTPELESAFGSINENPT